MKYFRKREPLSEKNQFSLREAKRVGDALSIRWDAFDVEQFRMGMDVELEHGRRDPTTDVTHDEPMVTGKIALAHLNEFPDYYTRLAVMENEAGRSQQAQGREVPRKVHTTERNTVGKVLSAVVFTMMIVLKVWWASRPSPSTTAGSRHGSLLR